MHANAAHHFYCDVKVLIQERYCLDINMFVMTSVNCTMFIYVSNSMAYFHRSFFSSLFLLFSKSFSYNMCLNLCPREQRCTGSILFLNVFILNVKIQFRNLFSMPYGLLIYVCSKEYPFIFSKL